MKQFTRKPLIAILLSTLLLLFPSSFRNDADSIIALASADPASKQLKTHFSGALEFHRNSYSLLPPHDTKLYDVLQLQPNATMADIRKNYRRVCRRYHPDKTCNKSFNMRKWEEIQLAHNILKRDDLRLLYHKYGLIQNTTLSQTNSIGLFLKLVAQGVTKRYPESSYNQWTFEQLQLLQLMGYDPNRIVSTTPEQSSIKNNYNPYYVCISVEDRISYMSTQLVETIRPLVEGTISQETFAHNVATIMDQLKRAPLGAQMLRCIGRAYRHSGQRVLLQHKSVKKKKVFVEPKSKLVLPLAFAVQNKWRVSKQLCTAVAATSKYMFQEHKVLSSERRKGKKAPNTKLINFPELGSLPQYQDEETDDPFPQIDIDDDVLLHGSDDEDNEEEDKWNRAILESLQVEALWSLTKIDMDRIVQKACYKILSGECFFNAHSTSRSHGWVGSTGEIIGTHAGRLRAAAAMVLLGDIMVSSSKRNTSWLN